MKKVLAIIAAVAVAAAVSIAVIQSKKADSEIETETRTTESMVDMTDFSVTEESSAVSESFTEKTTQKTTESTAPVSGKGSFTAQIESFSGSMMIVAPDAGTSERSSADKISFSVSGINVTDANGKAVKADDVQNFSAAKIAYSGGIKETYPAQINAQSVVLSSRKYCNVYFDVDGTVVKTLRIPVGGSVNSSDMPNAGAYCADGSYFDGWTDGSADVSSLTNVTDSMTLTAKIIKN